MRKEESEHLTGDEEITDEIFTVAHQILVAADDNRRFTRSTINDTTFLCPLISEELFKKEENRWRVIRTNAPKSVYAGVW